MANLDFEPDYLPEEVYSIAGKSLKFDTKEDIQPYLDELSKLSNVKKIDFSGNTIGIEASKHLADAVEKHISTLEEVNFADLFTGRLKDEIPRSLEYLLPVLTKGKNLRIVNLSDNAFGLQTIEPVEDFIAKAVYMQHLILSNNGMGPFAGARIGKSLYRLSVLKQKLKEPSLKTFICGRNRLENGSITYLSIGLKAHKDLEIVKLYQNGIRPQGIAKLILQGLRYNKKLTILDLQDNTITKKSAVVLSENLNNWGLLKELNVNDCLLNPLGSLHLVKAFNSNEILLNFESLRLQYNELDNEALEILTKVIKNKLPNLKILELNGNRFPEENSFIDEINEIFKERGFGELDELDDLEEIDSEDEEEESESEKEEEEEEIEAEFLGLELEEEEDHFTPNDKDAEVDELEAKLEKVSI